MLRLCLRRLARLFSLLAPAIVAAALFFVGAAEWAASPGPLPDEKPVVVERGQGVQKIAESLRDAGVITEPRLFTLLAALPRFHGLKAGEYLFPAHVSTLDALTMIRDGRVYIHRLTVPEGRTVLEIIDQLTAEPALVGDALPLPPEGSLLPETYHFVLGDRRQGVVDRMQKAMKDASAALWDLRGKDLPFKNLDEAIVLASIVERETALPEERARVAGVYINRLRQGMRLQADPTVVYAVSNGKSTLDRALTLADLQTASPYNTYLNAGLPPGPIGNPGKASLAAVLNPEQHSYIYFVANGTGGHSFARTLDDHNANVAKWRDWRKAHAPNGE
jgi:UPF0755 protein